MGKYLATELVKKIIQAGKNALDSKVLVMGATFKEDVSDIRNSKVADLVYELKSYGITVEVVDPLASSDELQEEYGFGLIPKVNSSYDAVVVADTSARARTGRAPGLGRSRWQGLLGPSRR